MGEAFANNVEDSLEGVSSQTVLCRDKKLRDEWLRHQGSGANIRSLRIYWNFAPTDQLLPFFGDDAIDRVNADLTFGSVLRQEYNAHSITSGWGQVLVQFIFRDLVKEAVWQCHQNTGTVTSIRLEATATAVIHARIEVVGVQHNLVAGLALDIGDKTHAT